jgi:uncharacterized spore protein YtfJ
MLADFIRKFFHNDAPMLMGIDLLDGIESLVRTIVGELERSANPKSVVGDPILLGERTVIPLVSIGMGFGAGFGSGVENSQGGRGGGGGLGVKPVAVIIADNDGVRAEMLKPGGHSMVETLAHAVPKIAGGVAESRHHGKSVPIVEGDAQSS